MIVQIYFSAIFERVNHQSILYKLCSVGIGGSVLSIFIQFQSNRSQHVMVNGWRSKLVNAMSEVLLWSVLGQLLFLLYTWEHIYILENKLIGYADDSTLLSVAPSPGVRIAVAESLSRDFGKVSESCDLWGLKLNACKTKTVIISRSRTMHPQSPLAELCWRSLTTWLYLERHLMPRCFWEVSLFGFQSCFSKALYLEEVLASIPW